MSYFSFILVLFVFSLTGISSPVVAQRGPGKSLAEADKLPEAGQPLLDFVVGQGDVQVTVKDIAADTTIRLGLAPGGVTLIEFPADDYVFAYYPGDENFVTLDAALVQRRRPGDPLVFRPGAGFAVPGPGDNVTARYGQLTVQMVSGLVFTFHIYPVRELRHSTTRVAMSYSVAEVVSARSRAGLSVNLHLREMNPTLPVGLPLQPDAQVVEPAAAPDVAAEPETAALPIAPEPEITPLTPEASARQQAHTVLAEMLDLAAGPKQLRPKFPVTVRRHGLKVAALPTRLLPDDAQLDVIAVTNLLNRPLRLVNLPEMAVETRAGPAVVNREPYSLLGQAHNLPADGLLAPGQTYFFILVTRPPVLGAKQFLTIAVAQTNAADEPAVLSLLEHAR